MKLSFLFHLYPEADTIFLNQQGTYITLCLRMNFFSPLTYLSLLFGLRVDCGWHTIVISEECALTERERNSEVFQVRFQYAFTLIQVSHELGTGDVISARICL